VAPGRVHEQLERVERAVRGGSVLRRAGFCAHDHVALFERGAQCREVVVGELVLVGERLDLLLLDETALGGLLDKTLGRREVVQMNGFAQLDPFRGSVRAAVPLPWPVPCARGDPRVCRERPSS
jgi:hypothetical protein